ncbi:MAG: MutS-related protein, partial [Gemmatimonadaceae bacterium]
RGFRSLARRRARESGTIPTISFDALGGHRAMLELAAGSVFESPLLTSLTARLREGSGAGPALARVERIAVWAEVRHSPMLHFALDWLLLWDFHVGVAFDAWKRSAGRDVRRWLETLGEIEALAALSTLAHDQPGWTFPETRETGAVMIEAEGLAHPLIADAQRVANDITVGPTGTFLLITGSNMSGKSTLLRAIGANCVLAQAGGPVCAARYRAHTVRIQTSMRIEDSLADGVSLFMAELHRIKRVVDAARERAPGEPPVLYLFDEVLHGTNSSERRVAARTVLGHLLAAGAIGAITSHDLSLAADGEIEKAARCVSFADSIDRGSGTPVLHFDYRLRQGLATSTNALALLDIVGLGADTHP